MMAKAKDRYKEVQRAARIDVQKKISQAGRLDLWGRLVSPNPKLVIRTSIDVGFSTEDSRKLVFLLEDTLTVRVL